MKLVLGSKSPRRKELLSGLGFEFEVRTKETDESFPVAMNPFDVALYIAERKAAELLGELGKEEVLICADTVVIIDSIILGKPSSREEAIAMLQSLSGRTHTVITGVVLASLKKEVQLSVSTSVVFNALELEEIESYIDSYQPYDKAGSYGIQEWIGYAAIKRIEGSYTNVVGLPTHEVYQALKQFQQDQNQ
jgi:septum formation protein